MVDLAANALTTVATVQDELRLTTLTATETARITRYINSASSAIEQACSRSFGRASPTAELHQAEGFLTLVLDRPPILTLTSISFYDSVIPAASYEIFDAGAGIVRFLFGTANGRWYESNCAFSFHGDVIPGSSRNLYSVSYTGGYVLPKDAVVGVTANPLAVPPVVGVTAVPSTLPPDLEEACIIAVAERYMTTPRDVTVNSHSILGFSETYSVNLTQGQESAYGLSPKVMQKIAPYRRPVIL